VQRKELIATPDKTACTREDAEKEVDYRRHHEIISEVSHGRHPTNQRSRSARKDKGKSSPASLRLRGRGQMPDVQSGWFYIVRQLAVPGGGAAEDTGNHLLLSLTRRSERCRSGSEISGAGLCQRQGAERRSRGMEGCGIRDELNDLDVICTIPKHPSTIKLCSSVGFKESLPTPRH
jgi:hypothetical protein